MDTPYHHNMRWCAAVHTHEKPWQMPFWMWFYNIYRASNLVFFYSRRYCDGESATDKNDFIKQTNLFTLPNRPTDRPTTGWYCHFCIHRQPEYWFNRNGISHLLKRHKMRFIFFFANRIIRSILLSVGRANDKCLCMYKYCCVCVCVCSKCYYS